MMPRKHGHYGGLSQSKWIITLFDLSLLLFAHFTRLKIKPIRKKLVVKKLIYFFLPSLNQAHILNALIKTFSLNRCLYKSPRIIIENH